jgi:hypothetical protein
MGNQLIFNAKPGWFDRSKTVTNERIKQDIIRLYKWHSDQLHENFFVDYITAMEKKIFS